MRITKKRKPAARLTPKQRTLLDAVMVDPSKYDFEEAITYINHDTERRPHWSHAVTDWPCDRWDSLSSAPFKGPICTWIRVRTKNHRERVVHYANGGGEDQPCFEGWFEQLGTHMNEISHQDITGWQPLFAKDNPPRKD